MLLMQSLQIRVWQRDSAIPKLSFCPALVLLSVQEKPEVQQVALSRLTDRNTSSRTPYDVIKAAKGLMS